MTPNLQIIQIFENGKRHFISFVEISVTCVKLLNNNNNNSNNNNNNNNNNNKIFINIFQTSCHLQG